ncbi:MAG: hypothetical protein ACT4PW_05750 [Acidimicrobiia bacterium]
MLRSIEAGSSASCTGCGAPVKFRAKSKLQQVICNVYVDGRWARVEHFHLECYNDAGEPHGAPAIGVPIKAAQLVAAATTNAA